MENKEIYFGFDMGTENIGFAVCDENYKVKKVNGRKAWGVRFFWHGRNSRTKKDL